MATPRALDPDYLRRLLDPEQGGDPGTPRDVLATRLTDHNRAMGSDVVVTPRLVTAAISRWRDTWEAGGLDLSARVPQRRELVRLLVANSGRKIADQYHMHPLIQQLRHIDRLRQGLPVPSKRVGSAQALEAGLRREKRVIDVSALGKPYTRPARPDELDAAGELTEIVCASLVRPLAEGTEDARPS